MYVCCPLSAGTRIIGCGARAASLPLAGRGVSRARMCAVHSVLPLPVLLCLELPLNDIPTIRIVNPGPVSPNRRRTFVGFIVAESCLVRH